MERPELIVMLTQNDVTIPNAFEVFDQAKNSNARCWGLKESGLEIDEMKHLFSYMKDYNKTTFLEVVEYDEEKCLEGAKIAHECDCDILMGTKFYQSINLYCLENDIRYMPFIGDIHDRPSILEGNERNMIDEAKRYIDKGAYGIDLLGYRYIYNPYKLNKAIRKNVDAPLCIAGSINSLYRLGEIREINPDYFTIGGAFFENKFGGTIEEQINKVVKYVKR